ncbi:MAG: Orn/Lys/Arg decarboxylase N-terminal domain-containing protein [bacterium]
MNLFEKMTVAIVDDEIRLETPAGCAIRAVIQKLKEMDLHVVELLSYENALSAVVRMPELDAIVVTWDPVTEASRKMVTDLILTYRERNHEIPVFLSASPDAVKDLPLELERTLAEYFWILEDTTEFIAGRIEAAARRYRERLLPPFFGALVDFAEDFEYSWHTPGHEGGTAFLKSPSGRFFHRFFGEQLLRSDLSISVGELGSLLDHSGPIGEAERYAAKVFGADNTYFITNGTSTANKVILLACATKGDTVVIDRNCHKSLEHSTILSDALPIWMIPVRNRYGIIGPIQIHELQKETLLAKMKASPLIADKKKLPVYGVVTNSTYDGVCYHAVTVEDLLGQTVPRLHFDEAWYGYARFNPLYAERFAMRDGERKENGPTVFASQSTHKLLAALSQASMIHVRQGREPIEHSRFNESFMMHTSTSPLYSIIASLDVSSKMMDGSMGPALTGDCIREAVVFRQTMARLARKLDSVNPGDWWFGMWQPDEVTDPDDGTAFRFEDAPVDLLCKEPDCWIFHPGESWHGFGELPDGYAMLDPIKVTVLTPGVNTDGSLAEWGIPAALPIKYLDTEGIVNEKSGDYSILFLFSMGVTKGKWGTLIARFFGFKELYDRNARLEDVFPDLTVKYPGRYSGMTLPQLAREMHDFKRETNQLQLLDTAFSTLPEQVISPAEAYRKLVRNEVERVTLEKAQGRIMATGIVPYPPGIPMLMGGERADTFNGPFLSYLKTLEAFDNKFPGFEHDIHGIENEDRKYMTFCIKE